MDCSYDARNFCMHKFVCAHSTREYPVTTKEGRRELLFMHFGRKVHEFHSNIHSFYALGKTGRNVQKMHNSNAYRKK